MPRFWNIIAVSLVLAAISTPLKVAAAPHTFTVSIPRKVSPGQVPPAGGPCQVSDVRLTMSFAVEPPAAISSVSFQVTEPDSPFTIWTVPPSLPASKTFPIPPPFGGVTPLSGDIVNISAPDPAGYDSAHYQRYEFYFGLYSNYTIGNMGYEGTQQNASDVYTVAANVTTSGAGTETVSGACVESYDPLNRGSMSPASCAPPSLFWVPTTDSAQAQLQIDGIAQPLRQCFKERPGVDALLVLDKSGSMASSTTGSDPEPKIQALQEAVSDFVTAWNDARSNDTSPPATDSIGAFLFDSTSAPWMDGGLSGVLEPFATAGPIISTNLAPATCTATSCGQLVPGTSTSIGAGLLSADAGFPADGNRHVILLMSDGMQNTDPMVTPYNPTSATPCASTPTTIATYSSGNCATATSLPHEVTSNYQIHSVTVGTGLAVSAAINQQIAQLTGGFYINTEDDSDQLKPFFLELLQNVLKFNSYDTIRMISKIVPPATLPFSTSTPVSTTTHDVEFNLAWPRSRGTLRLTVTPPGGAQPIVKEDASGFISIVQQLPLPAPFDSTGDWKILVEAVTAPIRAAALTGQEPLPFDVYVMADDGAVKSDLSVVPADYKVGDNIRLRAKITQLGSPILGLGSHSGDKIQVDLIKPGESVGDILSDSTASSIPSGSDPQSAAEAKLDNTLKNDPSALKQVSDTIQLFDDGRPEHGDDVAGDGIYSALYPAILSGHYNFLFSVESTDPNSVRFSRQQLRTAYARSVPNAGNTVFQTSIIRHDKGGTLSIVMTPRVKPGSGCAKSDPKCGRMGPGWANYFWFTTPGQTPVKAKDNLDGTYTATLAFSGSAPPTVSVHFENVLVLIGDSTGPGQLPDPLGPGNVLTIVPPNCCQGGRHRFALFLDAGANFLQGTLGTGFDTGFSLNAGGEYLFTNHFSVEGIFGYHHFPGTATPDLDVYQFSADGKAYLTTGRVQPFVNGGIGGYRFTSGSSSGSTYFGGNVGAGVLFNLTPRFGLQGSYNFHVVDTPVEAAKFSTVQGGIRFVF